MWKCKWSTYLQFRQVYCYLQPHLYMSWYCALSFRIYYNSIASFPANLRLTPSWFIYLFFPTLMWYTWRSSYYRREDWLHILDITPLSCIPNRFNEVWLYLKLCFFMVTRVDILIRSFLICEHYCNCMRAWNASEIPFFAWRGSELQVNHTSVGP